jgi:hypothetical protein
MLATTLTSLIIMLKPYHMTHKTTLLVADICLLVITAYLLAVGLWTAIAGKVQPAGQPATVESTNPRLTK